MQATLDQMIQFCARQTKRTEDVVKSGDIYIDEALDIVNRFIDGLNYAKNKICMERYRPFHKEAAVIGSDRVIDISDLSLIPIKIKEIYASGTANVVCGWEDGADFTILFPEGMANETVDVEYFYKIPDFPTNPTKEDLESVLQFPEALVDYKIICYYACYSYHLIKGSDKDLEKTGYFINLWNDGFYHIPKSIKGTRRVKETVTY